MMGCDAADTKQERTPSPGTCCFLFMLFTTQRMHCVFPTALRKADMFFHSWFITQASAWKPDQSANSCLFVLTDGTVRPSHSDRLPIRLDQSRPLIWNGAGFNAAFGLAKMAYGLLTVFNELESVLFLKEQHNMQLQWWFIRAHHLLGLAKVQTSPAPRYVTCFIALTNWRSVTSTGIGGQHRLKSSGSGSICEYKVVGWGQFMIQIQRSMK